MNFVPDPTLTDLPELDEFDNISEYESDEEIKKPKAHSIRISLSYVKKLMREVMTGEWKHIQRFLKVFSGAMTFRYVAADKSKYRFTKPAFNTVVIFVLTKLPHILFTKVCGYEAEVIGQNLVRDRPNMEALHAHFIPMKLFCHAYMRLMDSTTDLVLLNEILRSFSLFVPLLMEFGADQKKILKRLTGLTLQTSSVTPTSFRALMVFLLFVNDEKYDGLIEKSLRYIMKQWLKKPTESGKNLFVAIVNVLPIPGAMLFYSYLKDTANTLRSVISSRKKESHLRMFAKPVISLLELSCHVLGITPLSLEFPLCQLLIGMIGLSMSVRSVPVNIRLIHMLLEFAQKRDLYVPLPYYVFMMLDELSSKRKSFTKYTEVVVIDKLVTVSERISNSKKFRDAAAYSLLECMVKHITGIAHPCVHDYLAFNHKNIVKTTKSLGFFRHVKEYGSVVVSTLNSLQQEVLTHRQYGSGITNEFAMLNLKKSIKQTMVDLSLFKLVPKKQGMLDAAAYKKKDDLSDKKRTNAKGGLSAKKQKVDAEDADQITTRKQFAEADFLM
ncbi:hypothetical protein PCE1_002209 [Barthelona sp. PCE]